MKKLLIAFIWLLTLSAFSQKEYDELKILLNKSVETIKEIEFEITGKSENNICKYYVFRLLRESNSKIVCFSLIVWYANKSNLELEPFSSYVYDSSTIVVIYNDSDFFIDLTDALPSFPNKDLICLDSEINKNYNILVTWIWLFRANKTLFSKKCVLDYAYKFPIITVPFDKRPIKEFINYKPYPIIDSTSTKGGILSHSKSKLYEYKIEDDWYPITEWQKLLNGKVKIELSD